MMLRSRVSIKACWCHHHPAATQIEALPGAFGAIVTVDAVLPENRLHDAFKSQPVRAPWRGFDCRGYALQCQWWSIPFSKRRSIGFMTADAAGDFPPLDAHEISHAPDFQVILVQCLEENLPVGRHLKMD